MKSNLLQRVISGSAAGWLQIIINLVAQLLITPIFLGHWNIEEYGVWLTFSSISSFLQILDIGHQNYVGNRFLILGRDNKEDIEKTLSSALPISFLNIIIQTLLTLVLINTSWFHDVTVGNEKLANQLKFLLLGQVVIWSLTGSFGGLLTRSLSPFGYYSRFAWWQTLTQSVVTLFPLLTVIRGGSVLEAGSLMFAGNLTVNLAIFYDVKRIFKIESILLHRPLVKTGLLNYKKSLLLTFKAVLEMFRQQGIRMILSPISGVSGMTAFATMRTGANVAMQGLGTITNPILPELARFLRERDQQKSESAFSTIWVVLILLMAPAVVLLQAFISPLFLIWTNGQVAFNPLLFSALSMTVLLYALSQPAIAVINSNNLLKPQLIVSFSAMVVVIIGMFTLVPLIGIVGAGFSLLLAEFVAALYYQYFAKAWLNRNGLSWPSMSYFMAIVSVLLSSLFMLILVFKPTHTWIILISYLPFLLMNVWFYLKSLPLDVINKIKIETTGFSMKFRNKFIVKSIS
ncbi:hypothetical protein [Fibrella aquatica]|uniref:hypothetical protein n=1 Tax=Fibrella aquatica TaxID=3242487 RepID=UPI003521CEF0